MLQSQSNFTPFIGSKCKLQSNIKSQILAKNVLGRQQLWEAERWGERQTSEVSGAAREGCDTLVTGEGKECGHRVNTQELLWLDPAFQTADCGERSKGDHRGGWALTRGLFLGVSQDVPRTFGVDSVTISVYSGPSDFCVTHSSPWLSSVLEGVPSPCSPWALCGASPCIKTSGFLYPPPPPNKTDSSSPNGRGGADLCLVQNKSEQSSKV